MVVPKIFKTPILGQMIQCEEHSFRMGGSTTRKTTFAFERRYASLYFIVVASVFVLSDEKKRLHPVKRFFLNSPL